MSRYRRVGVLALSSSAVSAAERVATTYGVTLDDLRQHSRKPQLDRARTAVMTSLRDLRVSSAEIAKLLDRDPSTVCQAIVGHERRAA